MDGPQTLRDIFRSSNPYSTISPEGSGGDRVRRLPKSRCAKQHEGLGVLGKNQGPLVRPGPTSRRRLELRRKPGERRTRAGALRMPKGPTGCGSPADFLQLAQWNRVPGRGSSGRDSSLPRPRPSGPIRSYRCGTGRPGRAIRRVWFGGTRGRGVGTRNGLACVTRDCPPSSGAAIFSFPGPQAKNGSGSGQTQSSRLPTRPEDQPSPAVR